MIIHLFNSSIVSGPEMLVLPAIRKLGEPVLVVFLTEGRLIEESKRPIEYARNLGHTVMSIHVRGRWDPKAFVELRNVLDETNPRIVHAHDVKASIYLIQAKRIRSGFKPLLVSTHHGASYRKGKIRFYEELYVRLFLPSFDRICCVCESDRLSIVSRGVPEQKVMIHLNGTGRSPVLPKDRDLKKESIRKQWKKLNPLLPDFDQGFFLGAVARLSPEKRHDRMLNVLSLLPSKTILLCFGTGPEGENLKEHARSRGVESRVFWMDYSQSISEEMAGFDMLLCLSDGEGIPINLLEAGWAGTPVFSTDVGGIPDLISGPDVGYLVKKRQKDSEIALELTRALSNSDEMKRVGRAFQDRVMTFFSEEAWLVRLNQVYESLNDAHINALRQ